MSSIINDNYTSLLKLTKDFFIYRVLVTKLIAYVKDISVFLRIDMIIQRTVIAHIIQHHLDTS